jgi:hypothetical protein
MNEMADNVKELSKFREELEKQLESLRPAMDMSMEKLAEMAGNAAPKLIKEATINEHKAKVTLYSDHAIRIEFEDKAFAEKYYQLCQ